MPRILLSSPVTAAIPTGDYSRRGGRTSTGSAAVLSNDAGNTGENETNWEDYEDGMK